MNGQITGKVIVIKTFSVKSQRSKFWGIIELGDIRIELIKPCKTKDETIEKLKRNVELIKVFGFSVKWGDLIENRTKNKEGSQKNQIQRGTNKDKTPRKIGSTNGKKGQSTTDFPF